MKLTDELAQLKQELNELRRAQDSQQQNITNRLDSFADKLEQLSLQLPEKNLALKEPVPALGQSQAIVTDEPIDSSSPWQRVTEPKNSNGFTRAAQQLMKQLTQSSIQLRGSIFQLLTLLLGPFSGIAHQASSFFKSYQARGLGPVFLMTVAGIITLTLGFGYLLQFSINHWFSELGKAIFGFTAANGIIAVGVIIHRKQPKMREFASGLVGLGLIINFLSSYFIGPYFGIIPSSISFILLTLITLIGFGLSMKLEAKVISMISLVGGSLAPMMLVSSSENPLLYLPYLLLIGCCAIVQSRKLNWPALIEVCSLLHIACIEVFMLYLNQPFGALNWQVLLGIVTISIMFYLYGFTSMLFASVSNTAKPVSGYLSALQPHLNGQVTLGSALPKRLLALPFALLAFMLLATSQLTSYNGEVFLLNAVICSGLFLRLSPSSQLRGLMLLFTGSFVGFAALNLISHEYLGLVLLLEALLLIWLGAKESLSSVRIEAYLLLVLGLILNVQGLLEMDLFAQVVGQFSEYSFPVMILILSSASLWTATQIMAKQLKLDDGKWQKESEEKIWLFFKESLSLSYAASILLIAAVVDESYFLNILPLVSLLMLFLAAKDKLKFTEVFAWILLIPLILMIAIGILDVNSFSFSDQPLYAQLARVELFLSLILASYWYQRYLADSKASRFASSIQLICFIALPLVFIPKVLRDYDAYLSLAIWMSCFISFALARYVKHRALIVEAKLLTLLATLLTGISCLAEQWQGVLALVLVAVLTLTLISRYRDLDIRSRIIFKFQWQFSPYFFALVTAVLVQLSIKVAQQAIVTDSLNFQIAHWGAIAAALSAYFAWLVSQKPVPQLLKASYSLSYALILIFALIPIMLHIELPHGALAESALLILAEVFALLVLARMFWSPKSAVRFHQKHLPMTALHWGWHTLLAASYMVWSYQSPTSFAAPISAILLVAHGSWLMFISLKPKQKHFIKLASGLYAVTFCKVLFVDMAQFEIIQKMIAFMVIGVILLVVSYFYQKMKNNLAEL